MKTGSGIDTCAPCSTQHYSQQPRRGNNKRMDRGNVACLYNGISVIPEKEANPAICDTWVDRVCIVLNEVRQTEGAKCCMVCFTCGILKH